MADVPTVSMSEAREAAPVSECVFLDVMPPELRLLIYELAFHGSRVHASLFDYKLPCTQFPALILRHSSHFNLLLSCRRVYKEALATFWSMTVLEFAQPLERSRMLAGLVRQADVRPDSYTHFLCSCLPKGLKTNIRHIRGMILPELSGKFVTYSPSHTATELLSNFKNLATCDISPTLVRHPALYRHSKVIKHTGTTGLIRFITIWGEEPKDYLANRYGIDATAEVVFLSKTLAEIPTSEKDTQRILKKGFYKANRFCNLSAGTTFAVKGHNVDDEGHGPSVKKGRRVESLA